MTRFYSDNIALGFSCAILSGTFRITLHRVFPVRCCPRSTTTTLRKIFFLCNIVWNFSENIVNGIWPVWCCPKSIKITLHRIFSCGMLFEVSQTRLDRVFSPVECFPKSIKTTLNRVFPVHCCLKPQGQHYIEFLRICFRFVCYWL